MSEIEFKNINPLKESKTELNVSTISENEKSMKAILILDTPKENPISPKENPISPKVLALC